MMLNLVWGEPETPSLTRLPRDTDVEHKSDEAVEEGLHYGMEWKRQNGVHSPVRQLTQRKTLNII